MKIELTDLVMYTLQGIVIISISAALTAIGVPLSIAILTAPLSVLIWVWAMLFLVVYVHSWLDTTQADPPNMTDRDSDA